MGEYRKKPVVIEAVQYPCEHPALKRCDCDPNWPHSDGPAPPQACSECGHVFIETLEGRMRVSLGDWIITGVKGEHYPCKPDIFASTYEPAAATPSAPQGGGVEALRALLRGYEKDAVSPERIAIRDALRIAIPLIAAQPRTDAAQQAPAEAQAQGGGEVCAHSWYDYGQANVSWCRKCEAKAVTGYEDRPFSAPPIAPAPVAGEDARDLIESFVQHADANAYDGYPRKLVEAAKSWLAGFRAPVAGDAVAKLLQAWDTSPTKAGPDWIEKNARRECAHQLRAALAQDRASQAAAPSAPVGVEGFDEWYDSVDARFWNNWDACNAAFHAGKRAALAQQPAAVDGAVVAIKSAIAELDALRNAMFKTYAAAANGADKAKLIRLIEAERDAYEAHYSLPKLQAALAAKPGGSDNE